MKKVLYSFIVLLISTTVSCCTSSHAQNTSTPDPILQTDTNTTIPEEDNEVTTLDINPEEELRNIPLAPIPIQPEE